MTAPAEEALKLQRPLPDGTLKIVATGERKDEAAYPMHVISEWKGRVRCLFAPAGKPMKGALLKQDIPTWLGISQRKINYFIHLTGNFGALSTLVTY